MKKILILGASSDIGIEVIKKLLDLKYIITAHYSSNNKSLKNFKNIKKIKFDFSKIKKNMTSELEKKFGSNYDCFINLVGFIDNKGFYNFNAENLLKTLKINSLFPMIIQRNVIKKMVKNKYGRILNGSSIGVKFGGGKNTFTYAFSKHCMEFIPSSFKDWSKNNVLINNLRIGVTNTKIHNKINKSITMKKRLNLIPAKRMAEPSEVADYIVFLISDKNTYITGQTLSISGGE